MTADRLVRRARLFSPLAEEEQLTAGGSCLAEDAGSAYSGLWGVEAEAAIPKPARRLLDLGSVAVLLNIDGSLDAYSWIVGQGFARSTLPAPGFDARAIRPLVPNRDPPSFVVLGSNRIAVYETSGTLVIPATVPTVSGVAVTAIYDAVYMTSQFLFLATDLGVIATKFEGTQFQEPSSGSGTWVTALPASCADNRAPRQLQVASANDGESLVVEFGRLDGAGVDLFVGQVGYGSNPPPNSCGVANVGFISLTWSYQSANCRPYDNADAKAASDGGVLHLYAKRVSDGGIAASYRCSLLDGGQSLVQRRSWDIDDLDSANEDSLVPDVSFVRRIESSAVDAPSYGVQASSEGLVWIGGAENVGDQPPPLSFRSMTPDRALEVTAGGFEELLVSSAAVVAGEHVLEPRDAWELRGGSWRPSDPLFNLLPVIGGVGGDSSLLVHELPLNAAKSSLLVARRLSSSASILGAGGHIEAITRIKDARKSEIRPTMLLASSSSGRQWLLGAIDDSVFATDVTVTLSDPVKVRSLSSLLSVPLLDRRMTPLPAGPIQSMVSVPVSAPNHLGGFLVAASRVFRFTAETPLVWRAEELTVRGGEPLEVFTEGNRARLGMREGTVLSLPSRVMIAPALPMEARPAVDFEFACGHAFALTGRGLYRLDVAAGQAVGSWVEVEAAGAAGVTLSPRLPGKLYATKTRAGEPKLMLIDGQARVFDVSMGGRCAR